MSLNKLKDQMVIRHLSEAIFNKLIVYFHKTQELKLQSPYESQPKSKNSNNFCLHHLF